MKLTTLFCAIGIAAFAAAPETFKTSAGDLKITPIQHATMMIQAGGQTIHVDPAMGNLDGLPAADLILITDIHGDHLSASMVNKVKKASTQILAPEAVAKQLEGVTIIRNGETKKIGAWTIEAVPMYNLVFGPSPGRPWHHEGIGNGYVLNFGTTRVYFSGDTECVPEIKALKDISVAFVAMNPPRTMPVAEAATCVKEFRPKIVYPYHYRGQNTLDFSAALKSTPVIEVRLRKLEGEP